MPSIEYNNMIAELNTLSSSAIPPKTQDMFFSWVKEHTLLLKKEQQPFVVPTTAIPQKLTQNDYMFYSKYISIELSNCYKLVGTEYYLTNTPISDSDVTKIYCAICLRKKNVVWVDFGFNVGCEFGGKHPALILRNVGNKTLIVAPISTNDSNKTSNDEVITFSPTDFCNLPSLRDRFTVVNRITPISVYRVDIASPVGNLRNKNKYQEILDKFKNYIT